MAVVTVVGAGRMGTAVCVPLADRGHDVRLVGTPLDAAWIDELRATGVHPGLGVPMPTGISYSRDDRRIRDIEAADVVVVAVSSAGIGWAREAVAHLLPAGVPLVVLTKGLEWDGTSLVTMSRAVAGGSMLDATCLAISGPCLAAELARRVPTLVVASGGTEELRRAWIGIAQADYYRVIDGGSDIGHPMSAALKNVYAMALGLLTSPAPLPGRDLHAPVFNAQAAVFAKVVDEMATLVRLAGGEPACVHGPSGVGDLLGTMHGRNFELGVRLGAGTGLAAAIDEMAGATLEGLDTLAHVARAAAAFERRGVLGRDDLPVLRYLEQVVVAEPLPTLPFERLFD